MIELNKRLYLKDYNILDEEKYEKIKNAWIIIMKN